MRSCLDDMTWAQPVQLPSSGNACDKTPQTSSRKIVPVSNKKAELDLVHAWETPAQNPQTITKAIVGPAMWERLFETLSALAMGLVFVCRALPHQVFAGVLAAGLTAWVIFELCLHGRSIGRSWGLRCDNIMQSLILPSLFAIAAVAVLLIYCAAVNHDVAKHLQNWHFWFCLMFYPFYGFAQHVLIQTVLTRNINWSFTRSDELTLLDKVFSCYKSGMDCAFALAFLRLVCCVSLSTALFSVVHWPDKSFMGGTALLGIPWAIFFLKDWNLFPLGLYHGWLGTVFVFWYIQWDPMGRFL